MKRLCIYLTYDKQKIVDEYIGYMLKELKACAHYLVVVCNELDVVRGKSILEQYADEIYYRENMGFDAGGFKDALCCFVGWDKIQQYDELILVNDSFFGPFEKMGKIFYEMDGRKVDFWGLIKFGECLEENICIPEHIQTFFCVVRSTMLHSSEFRKYWEQMPYYKTFNAVVKYHEMKFTRYFAELGYCYDTVANTQANDSKNIANNYLQYGTICCELIKKRHFPFLKKQQFAYNMQKLQTQENLRQALEFIDKSTEYDVNFIWRNLIRTLNASDLWRNLHLQYMIDSQWEQETAYMPAIVVFVKYREMKEYLQEYLDGLEDFCAIYIISSDKNVLVEYGDGRYSQCNLVSGVQCRQIMGELCRHEYICVIHDVDMTSESEPSCTGKSYFYGIWENLVKSRRHVQGIIARFEKEEHLGFLAPPSPYFAHYFGVHGKGWNGSYEKIVDIAKRLNLNCEMSYDKPPFTITKDFWIRGSILWKLLQNKRFGNECLPYLPYMWIYIVQDAGYYSGIVESMDYGSMNGVNLQVYLETMAADVRKYFGNFDNFDDLRRILFCKAVDGFCKKYRHIYIFGAGYLARQYKELIPAMEAFIVSDGQDREELLDGSRVLYLSEITLTADVGIIICMNENNKRQVVFLLEEMGFKNYLCI